MIRAWRSVTWLVFGIGLAGLVEAKEDSPLEKRTYTDAKKSVLPYRLLKPADYDPNKKYPLVLFLHGAGERGNDNDKQLVHGVAEFVKRQKDYACFLVAPQCPKDEKWGDWTLKGALSPEPTPPTRLVLELLETLQKEFSIDAKRIYVTGLSMGGFGTWDLISRHPEKFAAAVPICGGGDENQAAKIAKVPIWAFHGAKDGAVKVDRSRTMIEAIKKAGGNPKYTEYKEEGHASWVPAYKDDEMYKWLFAQKRE